MTLTRRWAQALAAGLLAWAASTAAAGGFEPAPMAARVSVQGLGKVEWTGLAMAGEWIPIGEGLVYCHTGGAQLRFTAEGAWVYVSADGGPRRPAGVRVRGEQDIPVLRKALDESTGGLAVWWEKPGVGELAGMPGAGKIAALALGGEAGPGALAAAGGLEKLTALSVSSGAGVCDLSGLERMTGLRSVDLSGCGGAGDLSPLAKLAGLRVLNLSGCGQVKDLSPLAGLGAIEALDLGGCEGVKDLTPLGGMVRMRVLSFADPRGLRGLDVLAGMTELEVLGISGDTDSPPVRAIGGLGNLRWLSLDRCPQACAPGSLSGLSRMRTLRLCSFRGGSFAPLGWLKTLESLELIQCGDLGDVSFLSGMKSLRSLRALYCLGETDLGPLGGLGNLEYLDLCLSGALGPTCPNLAPLAGLTRLRGLRLAQGSIGDRIDLAPIGGLPALRELGVTLGPSPAVNSIAPLRKLTGLTRLDLTISKCPNLRDVSALGEMRTLESLTLRLWSQGVSLRPLERLTNLRELKLEGDLPRDFAAIGSLRGLKSLRLPSNHQVRDLSFLSGLRGLEYLSLVRSYRLERLEPLAALTNLSVVGLRECPDVSDLGPLRGVLQRGGRVSASPALHARARELANPPRVDGPSDRPELRMERPPIGRAPGAVVTGRVLTEPGGRGVPGVVVTFTDGVGGTSAAVTGPDGSYCLAGMDRSGRVEVEFVPGDGPGVWHQGVKVYMGPRAVRAPDIVLAGGPSISGTVRDAATGQGADGVPISVQCLGDTSGGFLTGPGGGFRFLLAPEVRAATLHCYAGYDHWRRREDPTHQAVTLAPGQQVSGMDIRVRSAPGIACRLLAPDGAPAAGAFVSVFSSWEWRDEPSRRRLREACLRHPATPPAELAAPSGAAPWAGAESPHIFSRCRTDAQGRFTVYLPIADFLGGVDAAIDLKVACAAREGTMGVGHVIRTTTIDPPPAEVVLRLAPLGRGEFSVVDPDGKGVAGAVPECSQYPESIPPRFEELGGGRYRAMDLVAGWPYELRADAQGLRGHEKTPLLATSGQVARGGAIRMDWWGRRAVPGLVARLAAGGARNIERTCYELAELGLEARDAVGPLAALVRNNSEYSVRMAATRALGRIGPPDGPAADALIELFRFKQTDGRSDVSFYAADGLGLLGGAKAAAVLRAALMDEDPDVRQRAFRVIGMPAVRAADPGLAAAAGLQRISADMPLMAMALGALRTSPSAGAAIVVEAALDGRVDPESAGDILNCLPGIRPPGRLASRDDLLVWWWTFPVPASANAPASPAGSPAQLWEALQGPEGPAASQAHAAMAAAGAPATAFLAERLKPVSADPARIGALIGQLNDARYLVREEANTALAALGSAAVPALRAALAAKPSLDTALRIEALLTACRPGYPATPLARQEAGGVRVLELIATPDARALLQRLAAGAAGALLTRHAAAALQRLAAGGER